MRVMITCFPAPAHFWPLVPYAWALQSAHSANRWTRERRPARDLAAEVAEHERFEPEETPRLAHGVVWSDVVADMERDRLSGEEALDAA